MMDYAEQAAEKMLNQYEQENGEKTFIPASLVEDDLRVWIADGVRVGFNLARNATVGAEEVADRAELEAIVDRWDVNGHDPIGEFDALVDTLWAAGYRRQK